MAPLRKRVLKGKKIKEIEEVEEVKERPGKVGPTRRVWNREFTTNDSATVVTCQVFYLWVFIFRVENGVSFERMGKCKKTQG